MQYLGDLFYHPFTLRAYTATEKSGHARIMDVHLFIALLEDEGAAGKLLAEQGTETEKMLRQEYYLAKLDGGETARHRTLLASRM